ncbi:TRAP transporter small permease subunit [Paracoccus homiensis]|uniref:TRAP transporter small permease protein n=1 Tax=Paracoccus homiensis TaxID=364199 RepID=A0A1I0CLZ2_9RHOB|nr:TRAP transporter small permease [Paracoccus homiensis]SET20228.1 Tripartite ATP-independent transporter, DctQ component [Paracoccus homiensis]
MTDEEEVVREEHTAIPEAGAFGRLVDRVAILPAMGIVAAMAILIQEVVLRYVFAAPTIWAHETTVFLCAIAFIFGGLLCASRDRHIRVVLVYDYLPAGLRRVFDIVISAVCALSSAAFAWAAWLMVQRAAWRPDGSFHLETSGSAWNPAYPGLLKILLMVALGLLAIQFLILAINYAKGRR